MDDESSDIEICFKVRLESIALEVAMKKERREKLTEPNAEWDQWYQTKQAAKLFWKNERERQTDRQTGRQTDRQRQR